MRTKRVLHGFLTLSLAVVLLAGVSVVPAAAAPKGGPANGTTLAAVKTIDICQVSETVWRYSGEIAIWNQGAINTTGLAINDWIQRKCGNRQFVNTYQVPQANFSPLPHNATAGTTQATADLYSYFVEAAPLACEIRNVANVTITNHSGQTPGTPFGPSPKATWTGGTPPPCEQAGGCTYTQGYWGSKPDVVWPSPYDRNASF